MFDTVGGLMILLWIATFVLMLVWMKKAHGATQRLWRGPRKWASGWTIGGWFIPFANFVIPKLVLNEIERIAKAPRWNGAVDDRWRHESTSTLGWLWWIGLSIGIIANGIGMGLADELTASADELRGGYTMQALGSLPSAVALGLGAIYHPQDQPPALAGRYEPEPVGHRPSSVTLGSDPQDPRRAREERSTLPKCLTAARWATPGTPTPRPSRSARTESEALCCASPTNSDELQFAIRRGDAVGCAVDGRAGVEDGAVGSGPCRDPVRRHRQRPAAFVDEVMVLPAERRQIRRDPSHRRRSQGTTWWIWQSSNGTRAGRPDAGAVHRPQGRPLRRCRQPLRASDGERLGRGR